MAILPFPVNAQAPPPPKPGISQNLVMVIGILSIILFMAFIFFLYAKFCFRNSDLRGEPRAHLGLGLLRSDSRLSGVDQKDQRRGCCILYLFQQYETRNNSQTELPQDPNMELFVQREEDHRNSPGFYIGSSFRKAGMEILGAMSSNRFSFSDLENIFRSATRETGDKKITEFKEEMEMKRSFENRISRAEKNSLFSISGILSISDSNASTSRTKNLNDRRSVSDTTAFSRFGNYNENAIRETYEIGTDAKAYRTRQIWLPIAKRTVQWFTNREQRSQLTKYTQQPNV